MAVNKINSYNIDEILTKANSGRTKAEKIEVLRDNNTLALRNVLKGAFDDTIQFKIPEGTPPFKEASVHQPPSSLKRQSPKFRYFVKDGPGDELPRLKVESMFIKVLESIHPAEAKVVVLMKDKNLESVYKTITKKLVQEAFPGLIAK